MVLRRQTVNLGIFYFDNRGTLLILHSRIPLSHLQHLCPTTQGKFCECDLSVHIRRHLYLKLKKIYFLLLRQCHLYNILKRRYYTNQNQMKKQNLSLSISPLFILGSARWIFQPLHFKEVHVFFFHFLTLKKMFLQNLHKYLWKSMSIMSIFRVFLNETFFVIINEICLCAVLVFQKRNNNNNNFQKTHTHL